MKAFAAVGSKEIGCTRVYLSESVGFAVVVVVAVVVAAAFEG